MKLSFTSIICSLALFSTASSAIDWGGNKCQILDGAPLPLYSLAGAYIDEADFEGGTDTGLFEIDAEWGCAYFHDVLGGDIDMRLGFGSVFFLQTASLDLPESVSVLSLDFEWVNRMDNGMSLLIGLTPGFYSDMETLDGDGFEMPFRIAVVNAFSSTVSGIAGAEFRLGFDREIMPLLGLAWQPDKAFRLEAGLPRSLIRIRPDNDWSIYAEYEWKNMSYNLRDRDNDSREQLTLEDYRLMFGLRRMVDRQLGLFGEIGQSYHRSLAFERRNDSSVEHEIEKAMFLRVGVAGYF